MNQLLLPLATHLPCEGHLLKLSQEFQLHFLQQFDYFSKSEKSNKLNQRQNCAREALIYQCEQDLIGICNTPSYKQ